MDISIDLQTQEAIDSLVKAGRYDSSSDVVREGIRLVQANEAKLQALRETIEASIERGGSHTGEEVMVAVKARIDVWERNRAK